MPFICLYLFTYFLIFVEMMITPATAAYIIFIESFIYLRADLLFI